MTVEPREISPASRRLRLRPLSIVVLLGIFGLSLTAALATRQVVHDQEKKLLKQRTEEAALYLSSALSGLQSQLASIAASAAATKGSAKEFVAANRLLTLGGASGQGFQTVALVDLSPTPHITAQVGAEIADLGPTRTATVTSIAAKAPGYGSTPVLKVGGQRAVGFVYVGSQLPGRAIYVESKVQPQQQQPVTSSRPFSELEAAVYVGTRPDPDQLLIVGAGAHPPLTGTVASAPSDAGKGQPWLLVAKARKALVGSVATWTPWILLGIGLLAALLAGAIVETLGRRRDYANQVAEARTRELSESLDELAAAHEQLVRQERLAAIGELASTVGHELRNPLGVISNALFLLRGDIAANPSEKSARHLATAEREVSAATVIVSDLLEFARQRDPVMAEVDLVGLVDEVLTVLPPPTGMTINRDVPMQRLDVVADRDMLRQVLLNLIGNAYQAMPDGGEVTISLSDEDGVHLRVRDTGTGMSDEVKEKLFQPFFTTKARGVGLGLAVCRRIIDAHTGTIVVDSEPGRGAEFTVTLPRVTVPRQQVPQQEMAPAEATQ